MLTWWLLGACAACFALKLAGALLPARWVQGATVRRVVPLVTVGLLAGLTAVQTATTDGLPVLDARLAGLAVAVAALVARAPFVVVVAAAAVTTALLRACGWG